MIILSKERDRVLHLSGKELEAIFKDKSLSPQDRGEIGERAVSRIGIYWASKFKNHITATSFMYPQGEVLKVKGSKAGDTPITEIDFLLITPYRIFSIEIKTVYGDMKIYPNSEIEIAWEGVFEYDYEKKNYFQQNESHARHLYYHLHDLIPQGDASYIIPLVVVAGNMEVIDERDPSLSERYPVTTASNFYPTLDELNTPLDYLLDINKIRERLQSIKVDDKQRLLDSQDFSKGDVANVQQGQN